MTSAYSDHRHLVLRSKLLLPSKLKSKAESSELTFMPHAQLVAFKGA
ncbi:hypothetical protein [Bradyrhizobium acaciae]|nr:hypothetical protein [Bradyrhizobium acaciae]MCC8978307.1 hypothetical protein [Bradyrhizobium acaciae]